MAEQPSNDPSSPGFVPVCAIGASAGGVGVLQALFRLLPDDLGLAYVVVVHLAPDHPSAMHEILAACTKMPVFQVRDGPTLRANAVYVIAPDSELVIEGDDVKARPFTDARGRRAPIDMFFRSVAAARGDGIAVVLTGAGADGAVGVRAIKEAGGLVMVQEPAEAGFPSMPQHAIATGVADVVAPVARLAERIAEAARSKAAVRSLDEDGAANDLRRIVAFLRTRTGHDFSGYKRSTVLRRVMRRMQISQITDLGAYARHLRSTPEEAKALFADLLISVTMFFRDPDAFEALRALVVRPLLERAAADEESDGEIRAWVVGCATGEEAYGLAILILEEADRLKVHAAAQIFATDLDEGALATAREGRYPRSIEADLSAERLRRFFVDEGTHYRVGRRVRDLVLFATHSVVREPPFMRLDLVTCRNVLIYLERALQQHVCSIFHYGLKPGGALFLGTAETADMVRNQFVAADREARIYRAVGLEGGWAPVMPSVSPPGSTPAASAGGHRPPSVRFEAGENLGATHAAALEASAPPSALVDADHAVLHLSPTAGRFIRLSAGPLSGKLPAIVHPDLRVDLRMALDRAFDLRQPTMTRAADLRLDGEVRRVSIHVAPVPAGEAAAARATVFFLDNGPGRTDAGSEALPAPDDIRQLHDELKAAQDAALAGRIDRQSALQELRASNEELQSLNEEYRSTAEELETSKEELQSINEELQTVNSELKAKLGAISAAHDDLRNLTDSSEIGTLFLDSHLRIRMFTPPVAELFNVTEADVGRTVTNFTNRLDYDGLEADARRVLRDLAPVEQEVRGRGDRWYMVRVRPYRTLDDRIEGAVFTFDDITARKRADMALRRSEARFRAFVEASSDIVYQMSPDWREMLRLHGRAFMPDTLAPSASWMDQYIDPADQDAVRAAIEDAVRTRSMFVLEHRVRRRDDTLGWVLSRAVPVVDPGGEIVEWLGTASDVTARRDSETALRDSERRFRTLFEAMDQGFYDAEAIFDAEGRCVDIHYRDENPAAVRLVGRSAKGRLLSDLGPYEDHWRAIFGAVARTGEPQRLERFAASDGKWYDFYAFKPPQSAADQFAITFRDVTERRRVEEELRASEERQGFLLRLSDALRPLGDPLQIQDVACRMLGEALEVDRAYYVAIDEAEGVARVARDWTRTEGSSIAGTYPIAAFAWSVAILRRGECHVVPDAQGAADLSADDRAALAALQIAACVGAPLIKEGRLVGALCATAARPKGWRPADVELVCEVGERIWAAVERALSEAALRDAEAVQRTLVEGTPQIVWRATRAGDWTWASPQWQAYTGQSAEDSHGRGWLAALHPEDRARAAAAWAETAGGEALDLDTRIRDGTGGGYRWFQTRALPMRDGGGDVVAWLGTSTDVDDLRRLQESQAVMVSELQHRTRNLIAVVRGVADDTLDETGPTPAFRAAFGDRLAALSRVQGLLSRAEAEPITIAALVRQELDALGADGADGRVTAEGPDVFLKPSTVQTLALALHELATNARKYGALSHDGGRLAVTWRERVEGDEHRLALDWIETGLVRAPAPPDAPAAAGGYGRELIERALPHAMGARTRYSLTPSGVRCSLDLPVRPGRDAEDA